MSLATAGAFIALLAVNIIPLAALLLFRLTLTGFVLVGLIAAGVCFAFLVDGVTAVGITFPIATLGFRFGSGFRRLTLLAELGHLFLTFLEFLAGSFQFLIPKHVLTGRFATDPIAAVGALRGGQAVGGGFRNLASLGELIALGADFFEGTMAVGEPANGFLLEGRSGPSAAFPLFFLITAAEVAPEGFLTPHDFDVIHAAMETGRAEAFVPRSADPGGITTEAVVVKTRTVVVAIIIIVVPIKAVTGHGAGKAAIDPKAFRTITMDIAGTDGDAGDSDSQAEVAPVLCDRIIMLVDGLVEILDGHEGVGIRADTVVVIHSGPVIDIVRIDRFRRQGGPADEVGVVPPGNPGRSPGIARNPDPAVAFEESPAAVVIGGPAVGLIGNPGPALIGVRPAADGVGPPAGRRAGGLPDVTVFRGFHPLAIGSKAFVEHLIVAAARSRRAIGGGHGLSPADRRDTGGGRRRGCRGGRGSFQGRFFLGQVIALALKIRFFLGQLILLHLQPEFGFLGFEFRDLLFQGRIFIHNRLRRKGLGVSGRGHRGLAEGGGAAVTGNHQQTGGGQQGRKEGIFHGNGGGG